MSAQTGKVSHTFAVTVTAPAGMAPERVRSLLNTVLDVGYDNVAAMRGTAESVRDSCDVDALAIAVQLGPVTVHIVDRDSADGPETDAFLDPAIAQRWADAIGGVVREEHTLDGQVDVLIATRNSEGQS